MSTRRYKAHTYKLIETLGKVPLSYKSIVAQLKLPLADIAFYADTGGNTEEYTLDGGLNTPAEIESGFRVHFNILSANTIDSPKIGLKGVDGSMSELYTKNGGTITTGALSAGYYSAEYDTEKQGWTLVDVDYMESEFDYIENIIVGVTAYAEQYLKRDLVQKRWQTYRDDLQGDYLDNSRVEGCIDDYLIQLRRSPLVEVESFDVLQGGVWAQVDPALYYVTDDYFYSQIAIKKYSGVQVDNRLQSVRITFVSGFKEIPADLLQALVNHIAFMYTNRSDCTAESCPAGGEAMPATAKAIYDKYRIDDIGS